MGVSPVSIDDETLRRAETGDEAALEQLLLYLDPRVAATIRKMGVENSEDVKDLTQEVLIKVTILIRLRRVRDVKHLKRLAARIARTTVIDYFRHYSSKTVKREEGQDASFAPQSGNLAPWNFTGEIKRNADKGSIFFVVAESRTSTGEKLFVYKGFRREACQAADMVCESPSVPAGTDFKLTPARGSGLQGTGMAGDQPEPGARARFYVYFSRANCQPDGWDPTAKSPNALELAVLSEARELAVAAVKRLAEQFRTAAVLKLLEKHTYEQAAQVMGVPPGTVKSQVHRAREQLEQDPKLPAEVYQAFLGP